MVKTAASTRSFNIPVPAGGSPTRPGLFFEGIRLPSRPHHRKTAGWFYTTIIEPLGHKAKERNEAFQVEYGKVINRFTAEFIKEFCEPDGTILWNKLVQFNSAIKSK